MTTLREAAQQALEALEHHGGNLPWNAFVEVRKDLRDALAQEQAEPKPLHPEVRKMCDEYFDKCVEAMLTFPVASFKAQDQTPPEDVTEAEPTVKESLQAEPVQEPVAWMFTDPDKPRVKFLEWRENEPGYRGRWGKTPLYTAPPRCPNCASLEAQNTELDRKLAQLEQVDLSRCPQCGGIADNGHDRSIPPNPYLCTKCMDEPVADQTLDDAMQQPRAMAQAYESGYKAGAAAEREAIIQFLQEMQRVVGDAHNHYGVAAVRIKERV